MKSDDIYEAYEQLSEYARFKFEQSAVDTFLFWSRKTYCKVIFYYKANEMNKRLKRVGRIANYRSGGRVATRNLSLIPAADRPAANSYTTLSSIGYYDLSRANAVKNQDGTSSGLITNPTIGGAGQWRRIGRNSFSIVTAYYDLEKNTWVKL